MKTFIIFVSLILQACSSTFMGKRFIYYDYKAELDLALYLNKDSTFILIDEYGCKQMNQRGNWTQLKDTTTLFMGTFVLTDTIKIIPHRAFCGMKTIRYRSTFNKKYYSRYEEDYLKFPLIQRDTIYLVNKNKIRLRGHNFNIEKGNIAKKRVLQHEKAIIDMTDKKIYIKLFGEGNSRKKARERLSTCNPTPSQSEVQLYKNGKWKKSNIKN